MTEPSGRLVRCRGPPSSWRRDFVEICRPAKAGLSEERLHMQDKKETPAMDPFAATNEAAAEAPSEQLAAEQIDQENDISSGGHATILRTLMEKPIARSASLL